MSKAIHYIVAFLLGAILAGLSVDRWHRGESPVYKQEERTSLSDVVLEVKPGAKPSLPTPSNPKGGRTTGTVEIVVDGGKPIVKEGNEPECPPVKVRLDLGIRDGQPYVAARSENDEEIDGVFIPRAGVPKVAKYTATAIVGQDTYTAAVARNFGRFSVGGGLSVADGVAQPVVIATMGF